MKRKMNEEHKEEEKRGTRRNGGRTHKVKNKWNNKQLSSFLTWLDSLRVFKANIFLVSDKSQQADSVNFISNSVISLKEFLFKKIYFVSNMLSHRKYMSQGMLMTSVHCSTCYLFYGGGGFI